MTSEKILNAIENELIGLNAAKRIILNLLSGEGKKAKKKKIIKAIKIYKKRGPYKKKQIKKRVAWNKGKKGRKWTPEQKEKFLATMKAKSAKEQE